MADTTTWTPEARKIREAERAAARRAFASTYVGAPYDTTTFVETRVNELFPPPPPEYTYGREIHCDDGFMRYRRRSDGVWEFKNVTGWRRSSSYSDEHVRALAAEVPLTDKECEHILKAYTYDDLRKALVRVLRGEVK